MRYVFILMSAVMVFGVLTIEPVQAAELKFNLQSSQLTPEEQVNNTCYQAANSMKDSGLPKSTETLPKDPAAATDSDAIYSIYKGRESTCIVLENNGANDMAWGLGANRLLGCTCSLVMEIK